MVKIDCIARWLILMATFGAVTLVAGRVVLFPAQSRAIEPNFTFPNQVPMADWQVDTEASLPLAESMPSYVLGHRYQYSQSGHSQLNQQVVIEMRYLIRPNAELMELINKHLDTEKTVERDAIAIKQSSDLGSYLLYSDQGRAYLSACINPYGTSTVTDQEFKYNRNFYDIRHRLWPWLTGENLKDERCLWAHLSTSLESDPEAAQQVLEQVWPDWYKWWQAEFPPLYTKQI